MNAGTGPPSKKAPKTKTTPTNQELIISIPSVSESYLATAPPERLPLVKAERTTELELIQARLIFPSRGILLRTFDTSRSRRRRHRCCRPATTSYRSLLLLNRYQQKELKLELILISD